MRARIAWVFVLGVCLVPSRTVAQALLLDYGDAPDSYSTLLASDGARHATSAGFSLGATEDIEDDGQPNATATGDGADEDGVVLPALVACASVNASVTLVNTFNMPNAHLDAWI